MFQQHVHLFRGIAITVIVMRHVANLFDWHDHASLEARFVFSFVDNWTVMFVFIAGFLFQHLKARYRYKKYLITKAKNVVLPYVIVSIPALAHAYVFGYGGFADKAELGVGGVLWRSLVLISDGSHMAVPLWFIPMIVGMYVLAPVFMAIDNNPRAYYLLIPGMIVAMLTHRPTALVGVVHNLLYFAPVYLAGMATSHYHTPLLDWVSRHRGWLWSAVVALTLGEVFVYERGGHLGSSAPFAFEEGIFDLDVIQKTLISVLLLDHLRDYNGVMVRPMSWLAELSFGLYFLHNYVIEFVTPQVLARTVGIVPPWDGSALRLAFASLFLVPASIATVAVLKKACGRYSRYIVGC